MVLMNLLRKIRVSHRPYLNSRKCLPEIRKDIKNNRALKKNNSLKIETKRRKKRRSTV